MLPERERVLLTRNLKGLGQQGRSSLLIRFYVERRVLLLEILRIASTRRVQPSDSILRREAGTATWNRNELCRQGGSSLVIQFHVVRHVITELCGDLSHMRF